MISREEVKHIAKLARLGLTEKEIKKFQKELSSILDYFVLLKEVDVSKTEPTSHSILVENVVRNDKIQKSPDFVGIPTCREKAKSQKLLKLAPETKDSYLKVKSIL